MAVGATALAIAAIISRRVFVAGLQARTRRTIDCGTDYRYGAQ
jgi:hypothetical protein